MTKVYRSRGRKQYQPLRKRFKIDRGLIGIILYACDGHRHSVQSQVLRYVTPAVIVASVPSIGAQHRALSSPSNRVSTLYWSQENVKGTWKSYKDIVLRA